MGKVCVACSADIEEPKKPAEEPEKCVDCEGEMGEEEKGETEEQE